METRAAPGLENGLNRDTNQTIFILALLNTLQATTSRTIPSHSEDICSYNYDRLQDLVAQHLSGIAEIS
ncbi:MAG TPA: hypothetical protein VFV92_12050 [Candidatus Bathyarchaeia archaeon]|nr:hypothetical protein [Candidatus Bathyarchaeia archaeon]